jgi:branched-chain amino acid transport system substrate-binding protein
MHFWALAALLLAGCASGLVRAEQEGRTGDSGARDTGGRADARGGDAGGDADFRAAANKAFVAEPALAGAALESFLAHHPGHPSRLGAVALLALVRLNAGDAKGALAAVDRYARGARAPDLDFVAALAETRLGNGAKALPVLRGFAAAGPPLMGGQKNPDGPVLLHASLAEALTQAGDPAGAIDAWDEYLRVEGLRLHERAYARHRAQEVAAALSPEAALRALTSKRSDLCRSMLGAKAAAALRARGDEAAASRLEQDTGSVRRALAIDPGLAPAGPGDPMRLGLAVPLSGARQRLGEVVLRGASVVIGLPSGVGQGSPYHLVVRDSAAPPERAEGGAAGAVWAMARDESAIAILGTPDARAIELATRERLPFLLLDERPPGARTTAFQLIHAPEARATALARRALEMGARRFAILGPDSGSGRRLAAAFKNAMLAGGGALAAHVEYPGKSTAFSAQVAQVRGAAFDVLFVPDDAARLELIAPALAVADIWPRQPRLLTSSALATRVTSGRREVFLMSTALSLSQRLLQNAERYVQGAMLCPGFYPAEDTRAGSFVTRFREMHGVSPSAADAYGYDGIAVLRGAVERGARTRAEVLRMLERESFEGVTGDIRFGANHARIDPPLIYVVEGDVIRTLR